MASPSDFADGGFAVSDWYEVWADETHAVPYLLIVRPAEGGVEVLDPVEGNGRVHFVVNYEDAKMWLLEDEFVRVGRKERDDE